MTFLLGQHGRIAFGVVSRLPKEIRMLSPFVVPALMMWLSHASRSSRSATAILKPTLDPSIPPGTHLVAFLNSRTC